jgi:Ca2+-binding RTX toxin-like protein
VDLNIDDVTFSLIEDYSATQGDVLEVSFTDDGTTHYVRFGNAGTNIERFKFADGSSFAAVDVHTNGRVNLEGDASDDVLHSVGNSQYYYLKGGAGDDTLVASHDASGVQYMAGQAGNDTYVYYAAAGDVRVTNYGEGADAGTDTFRFADLNMADVTFSTLGAINDIDGDFLQVRFDDENGDTHELWFAHDGSHIERFEFADGSSFAAVDFETNGRVVLKADASDDVIYSPGGGSAYYLQGGAGDDTLIALTDGSGSNYLAGGEGSDTFEYHAAAGDTWVSDWGERDTYTGTDVFKFVDLNIDDVTFSLIEDYSASQGDVLEVSFTDDGTTHYVRFGPAGTNIERFKFADGGTYTADEFFL